MNAFDVRAVFLQSRRSGDLLSLTGDFLSLIQQARQRGMFSVFLVRTSGLCRWGCQVWAAGEWRCTLRRLSPCSDCAPGNRESYFSESGVGVKAAVGISNAAALGASVRCRGGFLAFIPVQIDGGRSCAHARPAMPRHRRTKRPSAHAPTPGPLRYSSAMASSTFIRPAGMPGLSPPPARPRPRPPRIPPA